MYIYKKRERGREVVRQSERWGVRHTQREREDVRQRGIGCETLRGQERGERISLMCAYERKVGDGRERLRKCHSKDEGITHSRTWQERQEGTFTHTQNHSRAR